MEKQNNRRPVDLLKVSWALGGKSGGGGEWEGFGTAMDLSETRSQS